MEETITTKKESGLSSSKLLFLACWLVYGCAYIARVNYSTAVSGMKELGLVSASTAGVISSVYFICYAVGQLVNGAIADKRSPFIMVIIGVSVIALANCAMFLFPSPPILLTVWWGINGLGQSMLWSPVFFIISNVLNEKIRFFAVTIISLTTPIGKISGYFLSGFSLSQGGWKGVFVMGALVMAVMLVLWVSVWLSVKKNIFIRRGENLANNENLPLTNEKRKVMPLLVASGIIIAFPSLIVHGLFLNGISEWIPSVLTNNYSLSGSASSYLTMIVPAVGVVGVFFSNFVYKKFNRDEMKSGTLVMALNFIPVLLILALTLVDGGLLGKTGDAVLFTVAYGLIYILQLAFGHILISLVPLRFSGVGLAATMTGLTNAINYGGSAISTYGMSLAIEYMPLYGIVLIWLGCLAFASVILFLSSLKWSKFIKD